MTKAVARVHQIQNGMANITAQEVKVPIKNQLETRGVTPRTELPVDASTNPTNDSELNIS